MGGNTTVYRNSVKKSIMRANDWKQNYNTDFNAGDD